MRLVLVQSNPTIGDLVGNAERMAALIQQARASSPDLIAFPELALSGYPPKDLLLQEGFLERCERIADELGLRAPAGITLVFGCPLALRSNDGPKPRTIGMTNSLLAYRDGRRMARYDKRLLPTYDVFDEDRYFTPGDKAIVIDVPVRGPSVFGANARVGLAICEDLWQGEDVGFSARYRGLPDPIEELKRAGAQLVLTPSASPFVLGKGARHRNILKMHAQRQGVWVASVNQVGGNDELVFDGHASVFDPKGVLHAAGPGFVEAATLCDLVPATKSTVIDPLMESSDESLLWHALVLGVRDYCRKTGFRSSIIGLSGGIDSALTAVIAAAALGSANVTGVSMPGPYSSDHSKGDAADLAKRLGVVYTTIPVTHAVDGFRSPIDAAFASLGKPALGASLPDLAEENLQSRVRGSVLMTLSNRTGAIVLTTGNKSELAVGYCTLYGDMNGGLAVLSDITKHWVYRLSRWCNEHWRELGIAALTGPPIPESTITKPPSAELRPNQTDQDSLPPYDTVDEIVRRYVEQRQSPETIVRESGIDQPTVARVIRLINISEFKRNQAAIGLKVTSVAFGSGRRWPIAQKLT